MNMKQRIIGIVVLLALGIILVPFIFDSETVIKPTRKVVLQAPKPVPKMTVATTAPPKKNFSPAASIIEPGAIEASADRILEHQYQTASFADNEPQDFEDREVEDVKNAELQDEIVKEEALAPAPKAPAKPVSAPHRLNRIAIQEKKDPQPQTQRGSWLVQLGSFSEVANANKLVTELKSKGFTAFTERDLKNKNRHRVLIGPEENRESAQKTVAKLNGEFHIKSILVRVQR